MALLPCPFCGGEALGVEHPAHKHVIATFMPDHPGSYTVECCKCSVGLIADTQAGAEASWNQRAVTQSESAAMTEERAREILTDRIQPDGGLYDGAYYIAWKPGEPDACLDSNFTADELEAIAWWMRNKGKP